MEQSVKLSDKMVGTSGVRPSLLIPATRLAFGLAGTVVALTNNKDRALQVTLALQKVIEDNYDENLRIIADDGESSHPELKRVRLI